MQILYFSSSNSYYIACMNRSLRNFTSSLQRLLPSFSSLPRVVLMMMMCYRRVSKQVELYCRWENNTKSILMQHSKITSYICHKVDLSWNRDIIDHHIKAYLIITWFIYSPTLSCCHRCSHVATTTSFFPFQSTTSILIGILFYILSLTTILSINATTATHFIPLMTHSSLDFFASQLHSFEHYLPPLLLLFTWMLCQQFKQRWTFLIIVKDRD